MEGEIQTVHLAQDSGPLRHIAARCCYCQPQSIEENDLEILVHDPTPERVAGAWNILRDMLRRQRGR